MALAYASDAGVKARIKWTSTDEAAQALLTKIIGEVNGWMETPHALGAPVGPSNLTSLTLDGRDARADGQMLFVRLGIRTVSALTIDGSAVASGTWHLRPLLHDRPSPSYPATEIWIPDSTISYGFANVVPTGTFGWEAIPVELTEVAEVTVARALYAARAGQRDVTGNDAQGQPNVSRYVSGRDRDTLASYRNYLSLSGGMTSVQLVSR